MVVLALGLQQALFWRQPAIDTDVMALLPGSAADARLTAANQRLADAVTGEVVVLLSGEDWTRTQAAAQAFLAETARGKALQVSASDDAAALADAIAFYAPHRQGLLTPEQRAWLRQATPDAVADTAMARLMSPVSGGMGRWQDDPLGLWPAWWQAKAGQGMQARDGLLSVRDRDGRDWALLRFRSAQPAFRLVGDAPLQVALDAATAAAARAAGGELKLLRGGVPLHAEAAASRAAWEVNTIGIGSLLAVLLLVWLAFRSPRPIMLVALSLLVGLAAGVAVTTFLFGKIHLLTLVFGASLAYATQAAISRQTEALGLDGASLEALARAAGSRAREVPAELATRLGAQGLSAETMLADANVAGLNAALTNVGYMLLGLIVLALMLSLRLAHRHTRAVAGEAQAPVG